MAEETYLSDDFLRQMTATGEVDILVAVPTSNNRDTIERVINAVQTGLVKYFPRERAALVNPDAGSRDGTQEAVKAASRPDYRSVLTASALRSTRTLTTTYPAGRGQGAALRLVMAAADLLQAKACAIISPDLESITPEWIDALVRPVYRDQFDFITPIYQRRVFEGLLVRNILSPLVRAAYGFRIEEPAPGDFGFSGALAIRLLAQDVWGDEILRYGAATWMTTSALAGRSRICQSFLGPKTSASRHPGPDLVAAVEHTVGALFQSLEMHQDVWPAVVGSQAVPEFGTPPTVDSTPARVSRKRMFEIFRKGTEEMSSILELILTAPILEAVRSVARGSEDDCNFPDELWVKTVYEFAIAYRRRVINRDHLLQALAPIYRGRVSSYLLENHRADLTAIEERREALQMEFERMKPYLVEGWRRKE